MAWFELWVMLGRILILGEYESANPSSPWFLSWILVKQIFHQILYSRQLYIDESCWLCGWKINSSHKLNFIHAEVGRIGIGICYDIRFQELAILYAARGLFDLNCVALYFVQFYLFKSVLADIFLGNHDNTWSN